MLLLFERKCRTNNDLNSLKEVCLHTIKLCRERDDWAKLGSVLSVLNKRRSQSKHVINAVVLETISYLGDITSRAIKEDLIKVLMEICDGKIYVEAEGARLHMLLSQLYEQEGDLKKACDCIQDVHVETFGALTKKEKAEYILEQIRLNLLRSDYVRAMIQSRKMNRCTRKLQLLLLFE